ncbi:RHS repeat-associated core domain-containing protein [Saccharothrix sp. Mg75]|uniref:RHS repeat domain-containing protein n=1 Tax=Saccharothrix sp. Mg75 TaxID=3445357 RepID=UPI003EE9A6CD
MRRRILRGFVLRAFGGATAVVLATGLVSGVGQAAPEGAAEQGVEAPESWTPGGEVARTPVGGAPPDRPWRGGEVGAQTIACTTWDRPGALPSYPMERHRISDRLELSVNLSNGNVMVVARDLTLPGTGLNLSVDHVYNSQGWGSDDFGNWQLSTGSGVGLWLWNGSVELFGPNGYCVSFDERPDGGYTSPPGIDATLTKAADGTFTATFHDSQEKWRFDADGWFTSQEDRNGNTNTMHYGPDGDLASITDSQGRVTSFASDDQGRVTSITDPSGLSFGGYTYDDGKLTRFADRDGKQVALEYDDDGLLTRLTDARGGVYALGWSDRRVASLTKPLAGGTTATTTYAYREVDGDETTVTDANGHAAVHEFDGEGRQTRATDALGHEQSQTWTANSDVNTATNALSHSTTYNYDSLNNLIGTQLPTGAQSVVGYTSSAHPHLPTQVTDPSGNQHTREYDTRGNLTKIRSTGLNADIETYTYNARGLVTTRKDGKGATTTYTYDTAGNLTKVAPPAPMGATTYTHDSLSRVTSVTDGNGVRIDYGYDKLDHVVSVKHGSTVRQANTYDANGNLTSTQVPGVTRTLDHDARNQLTKVTRGTEVVSYTYDKAGNLKTLTTPSGTATYDYDEADRLSSLTDAHGGTTTFEHDDNDQRTRTTFPGGQAWQTNEYDTSGRLRYSWIGKAGTVVFPFLSYTYAKADGTDTDKIQTKYVYTQGTVAYTYDALGRLTQAGTGTYSLDNATNLLSGEGRTYTVNAADQYTKINDVNAVFDGAGNYKSTTNPESSFTFSPTNQLLTGNLGSTKVLDFAYDTGDQAQPHTITETPTGGSQVTHVFTRTALGVTETVDNGQRTGYTRDPDGLLVTLRTPAGARYGAVTDPQGSVMALVDANGDVAARYAYSPYGVVTATGTAANANPFRYLGAYQLQRGHHLLGYRVYDSAYARFRSPDPTGQEPNPYNYAQGDPINNSDPTGALSFLGVSGAAKFAGKALGAVATPIAAGCYISRAWVDTDNSWSDEFTDLNACFNPFSDYFQQ